MYHHSDPIRAAWGPAGLKADSSPLQARDSSDSALITAGQQRDQIAEGGRCMIVSDEEMSTGASF